MEEEHVLTGDLFIDAYNMGIDAGKKMSECEYKDSRGSWYEIYGENEALKAKVGMLEAELEAARLREGELARKLRKARKRLRKAWAGR